jgi:hypothetical protein
LSRAINLPENLTASKVEDVETEVFGLDAEILKISSILVIEIEAQDFLALQQLVYI